MKIFEPRADSELARGLRPKKIKNCSYSVWDAINLFAEILNGI